jgi:hypothetical protein
MRAAWVLLLVIGVCVVDATLQPRTDAVDAHRISRDAGVVHTPSSLSPPPRRRPARAPQQQQQKNTVTATFAEAVLFGALDVVDPATRIASTRVSSTVPYGNANAIPFLMVGPTYDLPPVAYTASTVGVTSPSDVVGCTPATSSMSAPAHYSCATLSRNELQPWACTTARTPPSAFTPTTLDASLRAITYAVGAFETNTTSDAAGQYVEVKRGSVPGDNVAPTGHHHYDFAAKVAGVMTPLYCGECLLGTCPGGAADAQADAPASCNLTTVRLAASPSGVVRAHAAMIVPYVTFDASGRVTYQFQYSVPQLAADCAHHGVTETPLVDGATGATIGTRTAFELAFGFVYASFASITSTRAYVIDFYTSAALSASVAFQYLYYSASAQTLSLALSRVPQVTHVLPETEPQRARLDFCYDLAYLNTASAGTIVGPRILTDATTGAQTMDTASVYVPPNCYGVEVLSGTPVVAASVAGAPARFCPLGTNWCTYRICMRTAPQNLTSDGAAFTRCAAGAAGTPSTYDLYVRMHTHVRNVTDNSVVGDGVPAASLGDYANYDRLYVTMTVRAYPTATPQVAYSTGMYVFTSGAPDGVSLANVAWAACRATENPLVNTQPAVRAACDAATKTPPAARGSYITIAAYANDPALWSVANARETIAPASLDLTVRAGRPTGVVGGVTPLTLRISRALNATLWRSLWNASTCVSYGSRAMTTTTTTPSVPLASLVASHGGVDTVTLFWDCFYAWLGANLGLRKTDVLYDLTVLATADMTLTGAASGARRRVLGLDFVPARTVVPKWSSSSSSVSRASVTVDAPPPPPDDVTVSSSVVGSVPMSRMILLVDVQNGADGASGEPGGARTIVILDSGDNVGGAFDTRAVTAVMSLLVLVTCVFFVWSALNYKRREDAFDAPTDDAPLKKKTTTTTTTKYNHRDYDARYARPPPSYPSSHLA